MLHNWVTGPDFLVMQHHISEEWKLWHYRNLKTYSIFVEKPAFLAITMPIFNFIFFLLCNMLR